MPKLNQIVAIEKGVKSRTYSEITKLDKMCQKQELFNGFSKKYQKVDEDGEDFSNEDKKVQARVADVIVDLRKNLSELFDITATKDYGNCTAKADVVVGSELIVKDAPIPFLIFLEKQLTDLRTMVARFPVLDNSDDWVKDESSGLFKTNPISTHRTKKVQKPIVLYDATPEHPAQTQLISEDVLVGYWNTTKVSASMPTPVKQNLLERVERLLEAVKFAREEANTTSVENLKISDNIFSYLMNQNSKT